MIPYSILLLPFLIVVIFFIVMAGSAIYHIFRFDFINRTTIASISIFIGGTLIILGVSFFYFKTIPWDEKINFSITTNTIETNPTDTDQVIYF